MMDAIVRLWLDVKALLARHKSERWRQRSDCSAPSLCWEKVIGDNTMTGTSLLPASRLVP
jgi:hypothetical protein